MRTIHMIISRAPSCSHHLNGRGVAFEEVTGDLSTEHCVPEIQSREPDCRTAVLAATSSASRVLWETHDCFLDCADSGKKVFGPSNAKTTPDVDLWSPAWPAKSASAYSSNCRFWGGGGRPRGLTSSTLRRCSRSKQNDATLCRSRPSVF